ncbi:MAG: ABC transporter permease subunit [Coriobacteriales bacterium]|jgi:sodium transport system permease protein|nr:ABC transporter permease subunit [Coriobacteriales bacterium]
MMGTSASGLAAIVKKEFKRFFTDRRMVLTTLLLPGLMIFAIYSFMGNALTSMFTVDEDYEPVAYAVNLPPSIEALTQGSGLSLMPLSADEADATKGLIAEKEVDLLAIFPEDFDAMVERSTSGGGGLGTAPQVELYYNSTRTESNAQYATMSALLDGYKNTLMPLFSVNADEGTYDLVTEKDRAGFTFASMLPFLIIIFLFSGCMGVATESIAGEKERGTIATMLVTPLARWELALGKVVSLGFIALLSGLSSFIGVMLTLPQIMGGGGGISAAVYSVGDYALLLAVTLSTVLVFVGLIAVISAFARSVKEAGTLVMPLYILVMLVGVLGMFSQGAPTELWPYLLPVYNSVQSMAGIFSFSAAPLLVCASIAVNVVVSALCVLALTRMFGSERVMFAR